MTLVHRDCSILDACRLMRECRTSELTVVVEAGGKAKPLGKVSAADIVVRVLALGLDPQVLTAGDLAGFRNHS